MGGGEVVSRRPIEAAPGSLPPRLEGPLFTKHRKWQLIDRMPVGRRGLEALDGQGNTYV